MLSGVDLQLLESVVGDPRFAHILQSEARRAKITYYDSSGDIKQVLDCTKRCEGVYGT